VGGKDQCEEHQSLSRDITQIKVDVKELQTKVDNMEKDITHTDINIGKIFDKLDKLTNNSRFSIKDIGSGLAWIIMAGLFIWQTLRTIPGSGG
jgi:uncharacterized protein (DUF111 family)